MLFARVQLTITITICYMELINVVIDWHHAIDFSKVVAVC